MKNCKDCKYWERVVNYRVSYNRCGRCWALSSQGTFEPFGAFLRRCASG